MLRFQSTTAKDGGAATNHWAHPCDACRSAASAVYCRADLAYLCTACDVDIHSANPLARRHRRIPLQLISDEEFLTQEEDDLAVDGEEDEDEDEAASWLLLNPIKNGDHVTDGEVDEYLDLDDYNSSCQNSQFNEGYNNQLQQDYSVPQSGDCVVPIQQQCYLLGLECEASKAGFSYPASMSQTVSSLSSILDVGVVPQSTSEEVSISISHTRPHKGNIDFFSSPLVQSPTQLSPIDREARVMRYREKKKNRKFEKKIRYASRKAYADTRPRIKGRFVKRRDVENEVVVRLVPSF